VSETVPSEVVVSASDAAMASLCEKIVDRKTIVYETRTDEAVIKLAGEKVKDQLFSRFGFLKPKPGEVQFVSIEKHYEPYLLVTGSYMIDYYRKSVHVVEVDKEVLEVILLDHTFTPEHSNGSGAVDYGVVRLDGEERLKNELKASLILDKFGNDVTLEGLPSAPSERNPKEVLDEMGVEEVALNLDLDVIRAEILKRPADINRVVSEVFEVSERAVIYTPRFTVLYTSARTGEQKTIEFDGVTAQRIQPRKHSVPKQSIDSFPLPPPP